MEKLLNTIFVCGFLSAFPMFSFADSKAKLEKQYNDAVVLADVNPDSAVKILSNLSKKKNLRIKYLSKALLAQIYRKEGNLKKAKKYVSDCHDSAFLNKSKETDCGTGFLRAYLELSLIEIEEGNTNSGLRKLAYSENKCSGYGKVLTLVKFGEALIILNKTEDALAYLEKAKTLCSKQIAQIKKLVAGQAKEKNTDLKEWEQLSEEIFELQMDLRISLIKLNLGAQYARYVSMRANLQRAMRLKNKKLKEKYLKRAEFLSDKMIEEDIATIYGSSARYYKGKCALVRGDYSKASKQFKSIIKKPRELYASEAMLELGKLELEQNFDSKASEKYYRKALQTLRQARENQDALELFTSLPPEVQEAAKPKKKSITYTKYSRMVYNTPSDMEILNRQTAPWLLSSMEREALFQIGWLCFINGKYEEAKRLWSQISNIDADLAILGSKGIPNCLWRLNAAATVKRMVFPEEELKHIKNKQNRLLCSYAELNYLLERFEDSKKLYEQILNNPKSSDKEKAIACIGIGNYYDLTGKSESRKERLKKADYYKKAIALGGKTEIAGNAMVRLGCFYQASTKTMDKASKCFERYIRSFKGGRYEEKALYRLGLLLAMQRKKGKVQKIISKLSSKYPGSGYLLDLNEMKDYDAYLKKKHQVVNVDKDKNKKGNGKK